MALVSEKIYSQWFVEGHPIYENFKYIFQNPLWHSRKIPKGFSLCPYFWLSWLVGCLFLKHFFIPLVRLFGFLCRLGGRPVIWTDKKLFTFWRFVFLHAFKDETLFMNGYHGGVGFLLTVLSVVFLFVSAIAVAVTIALLVEAGCYYYIHLASSAVANVVTGVVSSGLVLLAVILRYEYTHQYSETKCNVGVYFCIWALLSTIAICAVDFGDVCTAIRCVSVGLWIGMVALSKGVLLGISKLLAVFWYVLAGLAGWTAHHIVGILYVAAGLGMLAFLGWVLQKISEQIPSYKEIKPVNDAFIQPRVATLDDWQNYIINLIMEGDKYHVMDWDAWMKTAIPSDLRKAIGYGSKDEGRIFRCFRRRVLKDICETYLKLPAALADVPFRGFRKFQDYHQKSRNGDIELNGFVSSFIEFFAPVDESVSEALTKAIIPFKSFIREETSYDKTNIKMAVERAFKNHLKDAIEMYKFRIDALKEEEQRNQKKSERQLKMEQMCLATTTVIQRFLKGLYTFTLYPFWWLLVQITKQVGRFFRLIGHMFVAAWELIKAFKHGVCPYVQFVTQEELEQRAKAEEEKKKAEKIAKQEETKCQQDIPQK